MSHLLSWRSAYVITVDSVIHYVAYQLLRGGDKRDM